MAQLKQGYFSTADVAKLFGVTPKVIRKRFTHEIGVLRWSSDGKFSGRRGYGELHIPQAAIDRVIARTAAKDLSIAAKKAKTKKRRID